MVSSGVSDEDDAPKAKSRKPTAAMTGARMASQKGSATDRSQDVGGGRGGKVSGGSKSRRPDLNVNVQIHISADASAEQIDAIFSSMRRYFDADD